MKKQLLFSILLFLYALGIIAQTKENTLSFREKKQINKALKTEIYTLDGQYYNGYLYYADLEKIYLTENPLSNDSITVIRAEDIYQIKALSHVPFVKRFLGGLTFSAAVMTLITADMYSHGDAIMIGPDFVIIAGTAFLGTPFSFLTALIFPKERTDFEYRTEGDVDAFKLTSDFMEKRRISSVHPSIENRKEVSITEDDEELKNIIKPMKSIHPEAVRSIHFMFGASASIFDHGKQLDKIFTDAQGLETGYYRTDRISYTGKIQANINNKIRPFLSFTTGETGYGSGVLIPEPEQSEYVYVDYSLFYGHIGADYVFKPLNNMMLSHFEFSVGGGLSFVKLDYDYSLNEVSAFSRSKNKSYTSLGFQLGANVDYFVSRNLSFKLALTSDILYPIKMDKMYYESVSSGSLIFDGGDFNTSNGQIYFGLGLHL